MSEMQDKFSAWTLPPPAARAAGEIEPIRVFDSLADAVRFLASNGGRDRSDPAQ